MPRVSHVLFITPLRSITFPSMASISYDSCLNLVRAGHFYVSYINVLGLLDRMPHVLTPEYHVSHLSTLCGLLSYFSYVNLLMPKVSHTYLIYQSFGGQRITFIYPLWSGESRVSSINPLWTRLSFFFYVTAMMPRVSYILFVTPCGLE